jgi:hypothetical protein
MSWLHGGVIRSTYHDNKLRVLANRRFRYIAIAWKDANNITDELKEEKS